MLMFSSCGPTGAALGRSPRPSSTTAIPTGGRDCTFTYTISFSGWLPKFSASALAVESSPPAGPGNPIALQQRAEVLPVLPKSANVLWSEVGILPAPAAGREDGDAVSGLAFDLCLIRWARCAPDQAAKAQRSPRQCSDEQAHPWSLSLSWSRSRRHGS